MVTVREVRREGDEGAARTDTPGKARRRRIHRGRGPGATDWNIRGQKQATKHQGPLDWSIQGAEETGRQAQGAPTGTSGEECAGKQLGPLHWNIRDAVDRNTGLDHPGTKRVASRASGAA